MTHLVRKNREPLVSLILYWLLKWSLLSPVSHIFFRLKIHGVDKVPKRGPFIIVSNHASYADPLLLSSAVGRPVAYMAKQELFKVPILKIFIKLYGAYPVNRSAAHPNSIKSALNALDQGWAVGIFLEGTRTPDAKISDPKLGAALIAYKCQVPLLPVSLYGTEKIFTKGSFLPKLPALTVRIGDMIAPPSSDERQELTRVTEQCAEFINYLHDLGR